MRETRNWTWQIVTAVIIGVFLTIHMVVMHLDNIVGWFSPAGGAAIDWANVQARSRGLFFVVTYIVLLGAALYHALYGVRNVLFELRPGPGLEKAITVVFWLGGLGLFAIGLYGAVALRLA